jgi:hypothetical protein
VREYSLGGGIGLHSFLPKSAIETGAECAPVDLEERIEIGETEVAVIVCEEVCDHEEDFKRDLGGA